MSKKQKVYYDEDVNYAVLEKRTYDDSEGYDFYVCPKCGGEYLPTFIVNDEGETMCIDCWGKQHS